MSQITSAQAQALRQAMLELAEALKQLDEMTAYIQMREAIEKAKNGQTKT